MTLKTPQDQQAVNARPTPQWDFAPEGALARCSGDCQHPCPSPSRLSGLFGMHGALGGEAYPNEKLLIAGLPVAAIPF